MSTLQTAESLAAMASQVASTDGADANFQFVGRSGHIAGFDFIIPAKGDRVILSWGEKNPKTGRTQARGETREVPNYGTSIAELMNRPGAAVGWARFEDCQVIYFYDKADGNFGYGLNVEWPDDSEWGYAPFESE